MDNRYTHRVCAAAVLIALLSVSSCGYFTTKTGHNPLLSIAEETYKQALSAGAREYANEEISDAYKLLVNGEEKLKENKVNEANVLLKLSAQLSQEAKELADENAKLAKEKQTFHMKFARAKIKSVTNEELKYEQLLSLRGVIGHVVLNPLAEYTNKPVEYVSGYSIPGSVIRIYGAESDVWTIADPQTGSFGASIPLSPNKLNQLKVYALNTTLDPAAANVFQDSTLPGAPQTYKNFAMTGYSLQYVTGSTDSTADVHFKGDFGEAVQPTGERGTFDEKVPLKTRAVNEITITTIDRAGNVGWPSYYVVYQVGSPPALALEESNQYIGIAPAYEYLFDSQYLTDIKSAYGIGRMALNPYGASIDYTRKFSHSLGVDVSGGFGYAGSGFVSGGISGTYRMTVLSGLISPEYHILINNFDIHLGPGAGVYYLTRNINYPGISASQKDLSLLTYNVAAQLGANYLLSSGLALSGLCRVSWGQLSSSKLGASLNLGGVSIAIGLVYYL
ncbi:MAG: DUF4398 domain-containing protein [Deltaproteobacteria bacterium]|nr:DUF4398 domain-containing protein [Deltaproteobacteria bacterium]MCL5276864.1 DUF4398 domain-containing protein [Deltaproteobacteria bacterium]